MFVKLSDGREFGFEEDVIGIRITDGAICTGYDSMHHDLTYEDRIILLAVLIHCAQETLRDLLCAKP